jgi:hypothetical protein
VSREAREGSEGEFSFFGLRRLFGPRIEHGLNTDQKTETGWRWDKGNMAHPAETLGGLVVVCLVSVKSPFFFIRV